MAEEIDKPTATPESAAITGGVPAAAEPSPQIRGREASARSSTYILLLFGVVLLLTALIADQDSASALGTAVAGLGLIAIGVMSITGLAGPILLAILGFGAAVVLTLLAFSASAFGWPQLMLLVAGAAAFISSFASLAAARRPAGGDAEPEPGVENV